MPAADGLAERVRRGARPRGRPLPARADRRQRPGGPPLPARHDGARDQLGHARRLDHRARRAPDRPVAPHRRPLEHAPANADRLRRRPRAAAQRALRERRGAARPVVRAGVRLRRRARALGVRGRGLSRGGRARRELQARAAHDDRPQPRHRGPAGDRAAPDQGGRVGLLRAHVDRPPGAEDVRGGVQAARLDRAPLAALARPRRLPRPPLAAGPAAQRADAQGPHVRADRRDRRRRDDVAARDAGRRAQLGLPLLLDPRLDVRALGPLHARLRVGGERLLLLRRRRRGGRAGAAADHVRDRRPRRAARADARAPRRLRARAPGARRQRRPLAGAARRLGRRARLRLPAHQVARPPARARLADPRQPGRDRDRELEQARPRHLGGPRRRAPLHVVEADVLGRARSRRAARRAAGGLGARDALARDRRRDPRRHLRARARRPRRVHAALRHRRARRVGAAHAARTVPAARATRGSSRPCSRSPTS